MPVRARKIRYAAWHEGMASLRPSGKIVATALPLARSFAGLCCDAGPGLNFLSIHKERLLIEILGPISAPETVQGEILRKAQQDDRFQAAATAWRKLTPRWIQVLPDDATPELATVVQRISGLRCYLAGDRDAPIRSRLTRAGKSEGVRNLASG